MAGSFSVRTVEVAVGIATTVVMYSQGLIAINLRTFKLETVQGTAGAIYVWVRLLHTGITWSSQPDTRPVLCDLLHRSIIDCINHIRPIPQSNRFQRYR
jgi:hypothetical protein